MSSESESESETARSPQNIFYEKCFYVYSGLFALTSAFLTNSDFITFILSTEGCGGGGGGGGGSSSSISD